MSTLAEKIAVMTAAANGEEIQCRSYYGKSWVDEKPVWNWVDCEYRVKPKAPEYRLFMYTEGQLIGVHTRNHTSNSPGTILSSLEERIKRGEGRWITDWLPLPVEE